MTSAEKGTAVATTKPTVEQRTEKLLSMAKSPEERAAVFMALDRHRQHQIIAETAKLMRGSKWDKDLSPVAQHAFIRYALSQGTDPNRHWDILGGKLYDNSALWEDLATSREDYNGYEADDLSWNEGLDAAERDRRTKERAKFGLPQDTKGACVVRIYRKGIERPFIGYNHAGNRVGFNAKLKREDHRKDGDLIPDPVGEQDPGKTAFTRAFRRAAKTAWPLWPYLRTLPEGGVQLLPAGTAERLEGKGTVEGLIEQGRSLPQEPAPANVEVAPGLSVTPGSGSAVHVPDDPYGGNAAQREADERELDRRIVEGDA